MCFLLLHTSPLHFDAFEVARRPIRREGLLRLNAGRAVLCDASGRKLDEETAVAPDAVREGRDLI